MMMFEFHCAVNCPARRLLSVVQLGGNLLKVQAEAIMRISQNIWSEIIVVLQKILQCFSRVMFLTLWGLGETPTKAPVAVRENDKKLLAQCSAELPLNTRKQNANCREIIFARRNPPL